MMLPTHAFVGLALALPVAIVAPEHADVALFAGLFGGVLPDLDMYVGHRKTFHFPTYYSVLAIASIPLTALVPTQLTIGATCLLVGAAVHSVMDRFGGGLELRPWEGTSERAVYDHRRGEWLAPRRWIRYDGAPEDLLLSVVIALPLLVVLDGALYWIVVTALFVGVVYTAVRRSLPAVATRLLTWPGLRFLPDRILTHLPTRYSNERGAR